MKRIIGNVIYASIITLGAYIGLYMLWGLVLDGIEDPKVINLTVALLASAAYGFFLVFTLKIQGSFGEKEVIADYRESEYRSVFDDFKKIIRRESKVFLVIAVIVFACFAFNAIDSKLFVKKTLSFPTIIFGPMCLFETVIDNSALGYAVSAVLDCVFYIVSLLIFRTIRYRYWMKSKR